MRRRGSRPVPPSTAPLLPATLAVILGGCGPGPLDPARTGGELLAGTEDVAYLGGRPFSVSPDHRWLVFASEAAADSTLTGDHVSAQLARLESYESYDLRARTGTSVSVGEGVEELVRGGGGMLLDGGCWISREEGLRVLLRDSFGRAVGFDPLAEAPVWEVVEIDGDTLRAACPLQEATDVPSEPIGPFRIEGSGSPTVRIVDADDVSRVYATHSAGVLSTGLLVGHVRLSGDGRSLAYTITPTLGSFVSNARAFLVDADDASRSPAVLAAPVYGLRWAPDGSVLYAVVEVDRTPAVYRWAVGEPGALTTSRDGARSTARVAMIGHDDEVRRRRPIQTW